MQCGAQEWYSPIWCVYVYIYHEHIFLYTLSLCWQVLFVELSIHGWVPSSPPSNGQLREQSSSRKASILIFRTHMLMITNMLSVSIILPDFRCCSKTSQSALKAQTYGHSWASSILYVRMIFEYIACDLSSFRWQVFDLPYNLHTWWGYESYQRITVIKQKVFQICILAKQ